MYSISNIQEKRFCQECGYVLHGRSDKKFCSDQCRATHHNRINHQVNQRIQKVNRVLKKNRSLIENLVSKGLTEVSREFLLGEGFKFGYFTHMEKDPQGVQKYHCYECSYYEKDKGKVFLEDPEAIPILKS